MSYTTIKLRRGTAADWNTSNPVLGLGEYGYETDTRKSKVGDGSTSWNSLSYVYGTSTLVGYNPRDTGNPLTDAIGDGNDHPLSERFATLAAAQQVFPFVTSLNEQIDECAITLGLSVSDVVYVPEGTYKLYLGLQITAADKTLAGPAVFKLASNAVATAMLRINNVAGWKVIGPTFDANSTIETGIRIWGGSADYRVEDVTVTGATDVGINIIDGTRGYFRNVKSIANGNGGTSDANWWITTTDTRFIECAGSYGTGIGWRFLGDSSTAARNSFINCQAINNTRYGFYGVGTRTDAPVDYLFTDCTAVGNGSAGAFSGFAFHMLNRLRGKGLWAASNTEHGLVLQDLYGADVEVAGTANARELVRIQADFSVAEDAYSGVRYSTVKAIAEGNGVGAYAQRGPVSIEGSCRDIKIDLVAINNAGVPVKIVRRVAQDYFDCYNIEISGGYFVGNAGGDDPVNEGEGSWWGANLVNGTYKHVSGSNSVTETMTNKSLTIPKINTIRDTVNNKAVLDLSTNNNASAVNYLYIANAAAGSPARIGSGGSDSSIGINLTPKGSGSVTVNGSPVVTTVNVPATSTSTGTAGQIAYDTNYVYVAVATNTWRRAALSSW
jgi:hypothetical protein